MRFARRAAPIALLLAALLPGWGPDPAAGVPADPARLEPAPPLLPPLDHAPLALPLRVTGTFGELRGGHFHGGLDFSTGGVVGKPVYAALTGFIERVRTSGAGYGRSLYLHARDGRLLVYGHLEQFARPIAEYVTGIQDSTTDYEQDLWPDSARFPVKAGDVLGWSGRSGTVPPHLHFEVRRGDVAYNPLRAGITLLDTLAPVIARVTLEPLDAGSRVNGSPAPFRLERGARSDTVTLEGRARAVVEVTDGTDGARRTMAPWSLALETGDPGAAVRRVELRLDRASWATDMSEVDYIYDRGRITDAGRFSMMLWAPAGFRPVVIDAAGGGAVGTLEMRAGDPPLPVRVIARDVAGHATTRAFVLRAPRPDEREAAAETERAALATPAAVAAAGEGRDAPAPGDTFDFVPLPGHALRVLYRGAPAGSRGVWFESAGGGRRSASPSPAGWTAIFDVGEERGGAPGLVFRAGGEDGRGRAWSATSTPYARMSLDPAQPGAAPRGLALAWSIPAGAAFEPALALVAPRVAVPVTGELRAEGDIAAVLPASLVLKRAASVSLPLPEGASPDHVGLFRWNGDSWDWLGRDFDPATRRVRAESRNGGAFALLEDTTAPRVTLHRPRRRPALKPFSHWALEARLDDAGSGVEARSSRFVVDGRPRPSEWDGEVQTLRWRPLRRPAAGKHAYEVVATDRAGNVARRRGTFVID